MPYPDDPLLKAKNPNDIPSNDDPLFKKYEMTFGNVEVKISTKDYTIDTNDRIADLIAEVRAKYSYARELPAKEEEKPEDYQLRLRKYINERSIYRPAGQTEEAWVRQTTAPDKRVSQMGLDLINGVNKIINGGDPDEDPKEVGTVLEKDYRRCNARKVKKFIFDILMAAGQYLQEYDDPN